MQHDEVIWQVTRHNHCSYLAKNPYNVTGVCNRSSCPLANSRYATIREDNGTNGVFYLYMKTIERAHMPKDLWERVKLPRNYEKALEVIDKQLMYWPKLLIHKIKQRLTKMTQMRIRMRKLTLKTREKIMTTPRKQIKREARREEKAEKTALLEKSIEKELLERLQKGVYQQSDIYNYPLEEYNKVLDMENLQPVEEEDEEELEVEYVEGYDELEEEEDMEDFGGFAAHKTRAGSSDEEDDEEEDDEAVDLSRAKRKMILASKKLEKNGLDSKSKKTRVLVEVEQEDGVERQRAGSFIEMEHLIPAFNRALIVTDPVLVSRCSARFEGDDLRVIAGFIINMGRGLSLVIVLFHREAGEHLVHAVSQEGRETLKEGKRCCNGEEKSKLRRRMKKGGGPSVKVSKMGGAWVRKNTCIRLQVKLMEYPVTPLLYPNNSVREEWSIRPVTPLLYPNNSVREEWRTQQLAPTVGQGFKNSQGAMATKFDVEKFNGANDFGLWKIKMEAILIQQGCDEALKGESRMSGTMTQEEKKKMGDKARSAIILCLGDKVLREVAKEKTAAEIWAKLESLYMTRSLAHRLCLKQQLFSFKMSESRTIEEQIAEFSKIVDDLENIEVKLEDEDKAVILLNALPKTFEHFRDALLYGKDQVITLEEVLTSIRTKEFQKLQDSKTTEEGASGLISVKGKGKKQSGKEKKLNPDGTKQVRCFKCQKMGHIKKFCPEKGKAGRPQETADVAEASEGYESAGVLVASSEDPQRSWVMDSGCSYHMCPVKEFFENLDQKEHGNVLLGNNKACRVQGVGSVRLKMFDNREMVLQAVRYVPELKRNLISISAFDLGGYTTKVEDGVMRVCSEDSVVAKGRRRNGLYILEGSTVIGHVSVASGTENTARLWHLRMGHISEKGLEELEKQDLLLGDKLQKLDFCDHCVLGKSHRIPFGKGKHSTERPFEYVHADLWGPARTLTHGGGAYFLSIIDDFSRRVWIYVLKNKSETFQKFKEWHTQIENQLGCRLKCLRTDNGLEFVSEEFNGFCKEKGIRRHRTVVGTPQQNGLAERMNRTILERVRCMLLGSGLSKAFWGEAANTAVYLINRSPSSALNFKTPMEVWSGRPADYSHLRVFGSLAFAHVRGDKLDSRAARCIFLGYADGVKGYRLWRLDSPSKLIISRDVIFDETRMAMHPENSGSEKKILVEVEHTTNGAGTPGGTEENQTTEGQVETGRTIAENRSDEFRTDLGDDTDGMSGEESHGKAAGVDLRNYQLVRDRERRISKPTKRLGEADLICYALNAAEDINRSDEPRSYKEALDSSDRHLWQGAMEEELEALKKNSTWRLVDLPKGKKVIGSKWIFKKKEATPGGEKARYKARLVAKGFTQIEGVDYHEIFAPVVKHCSVRVLMAIVAHCNLHLEQLDVRTAFLHGDLEETIYMKQPDGFAVDDRVCLLQKSLYGLKQSPRQWYRKFDDFLIKLNFKRCNYDDCVYTLNHGGETLYLLLYVDDILIASSDRGMIGETKARLADAFEMKELGEARRILGIDIKRDRPGGNLFLSQECYLQKVISRYRMAESKMANTPVGQHLKLTKEQCPKTEEERKKMESVPFSNGIGSIMYGMVCTRPDVAHGVSVLSQFMVNPGPTHWEALKWMLRYIRGSLGTGLSFQNNFQGGGYIEGFVDSDFAGCMDTRKSRSGYVFTLFGTAVSWRSTLQSVVALSTTEAEYYALAEGVKEALWLKGLVRELGFDQKSVCVHCDSQSAIHLANHQIYHSRTKHIDVKLHFVRSIVESGDVQICKIASEENPADMLTKPLAKERFLLLLSRIGCLPVGH
ncbi:hypothetical protein V8G54_035549 [Vigna mungo]|uniref:Uncharacterized protein n=1 Tax=Vigna mungo TaxID=3915 RepID=A0AAQ3MFM8_VIGMU